MRKGCWFSAFIDYITGIFFPTDTVWVDGILRVFYMVWNWLWAAFLSVGWFDVVLLYTSTYSRYAQWRWLWSKCVYGYALVCGTNNGRKHMFPMQVLATYVRVRACHMYAYGWYDLYTDLLFVPTFKKISAHTFIQIYISIYIWQKLLCIYTLWYAAYMTTVCVYVYSFYTKGSHLG